MQLHVTLDSKTRNFTVSKTNIQILNCTQCTDIWYFRDGIAKARPHIRNKYNTIQLLYADNLVMIAETKELQVENTVTRK